MGRAQFIQLGMHPQMGLIATSSTLALLGCNMRVEIGTASAFIAQPAQRQSITVFAHLDTGASQTTISPIIASQLGLVQIGVGQCHTANGATSNPTYAIDLSFVGTTLAPRIDLNVGSCTLPFDMATHATRPNDPTNFGLLIGRDIMSAWHIAWDGPSSMVVITD